MRDLTRRQMPGPVVQIEFIDHGPGLSEQDRERVFTPFYTRKAKGMGLGLSIVKGIVGGASRRHPRNRNHAGDTRRPRARPARRRAFRHPAAGASDKRRPLTDNQYITANENE